MIETRFKQTELGLIPEDWEVCKIGDFTDIVTGATPSTENPDYWNGHIRWMNSSELNNKIIFEVHGRISKKGYDSASTHMLPTNCVLIGLAGQGKTRGTAAINKVELCTNQSIGAILPSENIDSDYLYLYMDSQYQNLRTISSGDGGRGGLSKTLLLNFEVVKPNDIGEQKLVAEALNDTDKLVCELNTLIGKKRAIMQGAMQELLTARRRLPGFNKPWKEEIVDNICIRFDNLRIPVAENLRKKGNIPYYGANGIQDYVDGFTHDGEYILLAEDGANNLVDYPIRYVKGKIWVNNHAHVLQGKPNKADTRYLSYGLKTIDFESNIVGNGRAKLNAKTLMDLRVIIPSTIEEQIAIAEVLSDMAAEIETLESKKDKYIAVRQGMMQQLLRGKIRLI
mgnify:CR=1 FL=1